MITYSATARQCSYRSSSFKAKRSSEETVPLSERESISQSLAIAVRTKRREMSWPGLGSNPWSSDQCSDVLNHCVGSRALDRLRESVHRPGWKSKWMCWFRCGGFFEMSLQALLRTKMFCVRSKRTSPRNQPSNVHDWRRHGFRFRSKTPHYAYSCTNKNQRKK